MDDTDMIPKRPRGRPVRRMENGLSPDPFARKGSPNCRECPKWDKPRAWCPLRAAPCNGFSQACRYGAALITANRRADRRRNGMNGAPCARPAGRPLEGSCRKGEDR